MTNLGSDYWNPDPLLLQKGEAFIVGVLSGAVLVRVPPVEAPTRAHAGEALRPNGSGHFAATSPQALPKWNRSGSEVGSEVAPTLPEELPELQVVTLLRKAYSPSRVVRDLTGLSGGERYQRLTQGLSRWLVAKALGPDVEDR